MRDAGWRGAWPTQTRIKVQILQQKKIKHNNNNSNNHLQRWETSPGGCSSPPHLTNHHYDYYYYCYYHNMGGLVNFIFIFLIFVVVELGTLFFHFRKEAVH